MSDARPGDAQAVGGPAGGVGSERPPRPGLFREEALRHHLGRRDFGDVLRLPPRWTRLAFPLILAFVGAIFLYLSLGTTDQIAHGSGVLQKRPGREESFILMAFFPGETLPRLHPGMRLRVELSGHPGISLWTTAEEIGERIVGPSEARRVLGPASGDSVPIKGPVALVRAPLTGALLGVEGGQARLYDGMVARVETSLGTERLIFALVPGLKSALGG